MYWTQIATEVIVVGIVLVIIHSTLQTVLAQQRLPPWALIFLSGALFHLGFELSGLNKWYLTHGAAAMSV